MTNATAPTETNTIVQRVSVEFEVVLADADSLGDMTMVDFHERVENLVIARLGALAKSAAEVTARRGATGYRYFPKGSTVETSSLTPLVVTAEALK